MSPIVWVLIALAAAVLGGTAGFAYHKSISEKKIGRAETYAKELLDEGKAADVSEAVRMVGISRSTFYKYRDKIRDISTVSMGRHAIISMIFSPSCDAGVRLFPHIRADAAVSVF